MNSAAVLQAVITGAAGLGGVVIGAVLSRFIEQRREGAARYERAMQALALLQASRHGAAVGVPPALVKSVDESDHKGIERELAIAAVKRFIEAAAETRAALAALHPWSPDLRELWDRFEVPEDDFAHLSELLATRRRKPLKNYAS